MIPVQPTVHLPSAFAAEGEYKVIPKSKEQSGRASFTEGFPQETQIPLALGGVAPNRMDINGILHMVTALGHWQQSGGQWTWSETLDYTRPNIVFYDGHLWWCLQDNGPGTKAGKRVPATQQAYWMDLGEFLVDLSPLEKDITDLNNKIDDVESAIGGAVPVGTVIMYYADKAPEGYLACDGSRFTQAQYPQLFALLGSNTLPDMRGYFVRGHDPVGIVDPDGKARKIGSTQGDAIRNITGSGPIYDRDGPASPVAGAFYVSHPRKKSIRHDGDNDKDGLTFDASLVVPTAPENRPKNITVLYCIKHD